MPTKHDKGHVVYAKDGHHFHRCNLCNIVWEHSDDFFGDRAAHKCPQCGEFQWYKEDGRVREGCLTPIRLPAVNAESDEYQELRRRMRGYGC